MKRYSLIDFVLVILSALSGVFGILLPYTIKNGFDQSPYSLESIFPLLRNAWEGFNPIPSILIMISVGLGLGLIRPHRWLVLGLSSVIILIVMANIEMHFFPTSHNLWPFEFALYFLFIAVPTILGSYAGSKIIRTISRT